MVSFVNVCAKTLHALFFSTCVQHALPILEGVSLLRKIQSLCVPMHYRLAQKDVTDILVYNLLTDSDF